MMRRLEKTKGPEKGQERHNGCRKEPNKCRLMILLRERNRTDGVIKSTLEDIRNAGSDFDTKHMLNDQNNYDALRLSRIDAAIDKIKKQGNCDGVELKGLMADYIIEEDIIKLPKPEQRAGAVL